MRQAIRAIASAIIASRALYAQDLPRPEFEVASIRPSPPPAAATGAAGVQIDGSQVRCVAFSLRGYISMAYRVRIYQITGPDWLASERFDIVAKIPAESPRPNSRHASSVAG